MDTRILNREAVAIAGEYLGGAYFWQRRQQEVERGPARWRESGCCIPGTASLRDRRRPEAARAFPTGRTSRDNCGMPLTGS